MYQLCHLDKEYAYFWIQIDFQSNADIERKIILAFSCITFICLCNKGVIIVFQFLFKIADNI